MEAALDRNLRLYPKLRFLMDRDNRPFSRFLESTYSWMLVRPLSHRQGFTASKAIDELTRKRSSVQEESASGSDQSD